jgi:hypothetical protein
MAPRRFDRDERGLLFVCLDCKIELREEWAARQAMDDLYADSYRDL